MKKLTFLIALLWIISRATFAQIGFNNDGSQPDPSAGMDIKFSDKGLLIPRVALVETTSVSPVASPAVSLLVYNTATVNDVTPGYYYWNGTMWVKLSVVPESGSTNYIQNQTAADQAAGFRISGDGIFNGGNVGVGTVTPEATLDVNGTLKFTDGNQGADKVLTSDANGLANWQESELTQLASTPGPAGCYELTGTATTGVIPNSVAVSSNYVYVVNIVSNTMTIYDVSDPSGPVQVGSVTTGVQPNSVAVSGNYAYVANKNSNTMTIYDVSNPASPFQVGSVSTGAWVYPVSVAVSGNYAYVANTTSNTMAIYDVSNPASPFQAGSVSTGDYPNSVTVSGNYAYVANFIGNTVTIYLVSNPSSPVQVASVSTGSESYPTSVAVSGNYAYVTNSASNTMTIYNVSNPASPIQVGSVSTGGHPNSVAVSGDYAYVANYGDNTMTIYDVSVPASSTQVGSLSTGDYPNSVAVSVNYAYVANSGSNTMQIFSITCPQNIVVQGGNMVVAPPAWYTSNDNIYNANTGNVGIGTSTPGAKLDVAGGNIRTDQQLVSTVSEGTAPLAVNSTTLVSNLNADLLDGQHASNFSNAAHTHANLTEGTGIVPFTYDGSTAATVGLATSGVSAGDYTNTNISVDTYGRITSASNGLGGWSLLGNTETTEGTNFIGTTDNKYLSFRTNNNEKIRLTTKGAIETYGTGQSVFIGEGAGADDALGGNRNVFVGYKAGNRNTTGINNTAIGNSPLYWNTTGNNNNATGTYALYSNITGNYNNATGSYALFNNSSGAYNIANGYFALYSNISGNNNTANGSFALRYNTGGSYNTANGHYALQSNTGGSYNTANGYQALDSYLNGYYNTAIGYYADVSAENLINATAIGANAMAGANNTLILGSISGVNGATASVNVGIGTTSPTAPLQITPNGTASPDMNGLYVYNPTNSSGQNASICARVAGDDAGNPYFSLSIQGIVGWSMGIDNSDNSLKFSNAWDNLATATRMTMRANGNVGIGTTTPNAKLAVTGSVNTSYGNEAAILINNTATNGTGWYLRAGATGTDAGRCFSIADDLANRFVISYPSGNIGIGTKSPTEKLDVVGTIKAQDFKAQGEEGFKFFDNNSDGYLNIKNWGTTAINSYYSDGVLAPISFGSVVGIGTTSPASSAALDITSTSKGFLMPRMTAVQISTIPNPENGLAVFNTGDGYVYIFSALTGNWKQLDYGSGTILIFSCGAQFSDSRDGKSYNTVLIGTQCWMKDNLNYSTGNSWCYGNNSSNCDTYGRLYDWDAALTACPSGWHLPSDAEWTTMTNYVNSQSSYKCYNTSGWIAKSLAGKILWANSTQTCDVGNDLPSNNTTGFSSKPGGYRNENGIFENITHDGAWWSSTQSSTNSAWQRLSAYINPDIEAAGEYKAQGNSVRCVKD